jgi:GntR family transcriptional regulator / MocR family aminotransferase
MYMVSRYKQYWPCEQYQFEDNFKYHFLVKPLESPLPCFQLQNHAEQPLHRQLYLELRDAIKSGQLEAGAKLPATRVLAQTHQISRNTVLQAFDHLLAEGFLEARVGSGTFVARGFTASRRTRANPKALSKRGTTLAQTPVTINRPRQWGAFRHGIGALEVFPWDAWSRLSGRITRDPPRELLGYADPGGYAPLREAIASHLRASRAVVCQPEQIIVLSGSQQALSLCAHVLLDPGDAAWLETPGYLGARGALLGAGLRVIEVPLDEQGLDVKAGQRLEPNAKLAYITPSHQYPTGLTMSLERRTQLLEWAKFNNAWIVEDDYDSEYRYDGRPLESLQSLDFDGRVIYCGTFSKVLFPGLRLGYAVVPLELVSAFQNARALLDRAPPGLEQAVLNAFMREGHFAKHLRKTKKLYFERQLALREALDHHFGLRLEVRGFEAGMHLCAWLEPSISDLNISNRAAQIGLEVLPISAYSQTPLERGGLMLGYAATPADQLRDAVRKLSQIITV